MGKNTDETDPFARLEQTHRRLEERLDDLVRASEAIAAGELSPEAVDAVFEVVGYLERGGARHVADEEETLFPELRGAAELAPILVKLEAEHREHQAIEAELRAVSKAFDGPKPQPEARDRAALAEIARRLRAVYAAHIRTEEVDLFPAARRVLDPAVVARMGAEMMQRRPDRGKGK